MNGLTINVGFKTNYPSGLQVRSQHLLNSNFIINAEIQFYPHGNQFFYQITSKNLAHLCGFQVGTRPEIIGAVWEYIKTHKLQNQQQLQEINCNDVLRAALGIRNTTLKFSEMMTSLIGNLRQAGPVIVKHVIDLGQNWRKSEQRMAILSLPMKNQTLIFRHLLSLYKQQEKVKSFKKTDLNDDNSNVNPNSNIDTFILTKLTKLMKSMRGGNKYQEWQEDTSLQDQIESSNLKIKKLKKQLQQIIRSYLFFKEYRANPKETLKKTLAESNKCIKIITQDRYGSSKQRPFDKNKKPTQFFNVNQEWLQHQNPRKIKRI